MNLKNRTIAALVGLVALAGAAMTAAPRNAADYSGDPFPLDTCPVSGEKLGKDAVTVVLDGMKDSKLNGTQVKFCCPKCEASFKADPAKFTGKMNEAIVKAAGPYALKNCIVMKDEVLESDAKTVVHQNRVYRLCCKKCVGRFEKDPAKYAKEYETQVIASQKGSYKLGTCPISGKPLGDGAFDVVIQGRLVRACCAGCVGPIKADPAAAFAKIDAAK
jgi:YHS domain-containing protein